MTKPTVTQWQTINPLYFQEYERYIPTAFDNELSLVQKINKLIKYTNNIGDLLNGIGEQWNAIVDWVLNEGLENAVNDKLTEWLNDGTLDGLIEKMINALPFINVKRYIEVNNLPQTQGFQECLDLAKIGGVTLIIPPNYTINTTAELVVYSNTKIEAYGATIVRNHDGYILINGLRGSTTAGYNGFSNITIEGGTWDNNGVTKAATASGISFAHAKNLVFRDMTLLNANSHHIEVNACMNVLFQNVKCYDFSSTSSNMTSEAIQLDHATTYDAFGAKDGTHCKNVTFRDCYFGARGANGTQACPRGIGSHAALMGVYHEDIIIEGCTFDSCTDFGIQSYNWMNVKMFNNTFKNCVGGIIVYTPYKDTDKFDVNGNPASYQTVRNYDIFDNKMTGISSKSHIRILGTTDANVLNCKIHHNTLENQVLNGGGACIYASYFNDLDIAHNTIHNVYASAVSVESGTNVRISHNRIYNILTGNGVRVLTGCDMVVIMSNSISSIDWHGIFLSDTITYFRIIGNSTYNVNKLVNSYNHIHIVTGCNNGIIIGNQTRETSPKADYGLYITNTNSQIVRTSNIFKDVGAVGSVYDANSVSVNNGDII